MGYYPPKTWSIEHIVALQEEHYDPIMVNRTNNPLKRFNRTLNEAMGCNSHPSMTRFVEIIKKLSNDCVTKLHDIHMGIRNKVDIVEATIHPVPEAYLAWRP